MPEAQNAEQAPHIVGEWSGECLPECPCGEGRVPLPPEDHDAQCKCPACMVGWGDAPGRVQACEHNRVTWWPNGQECDACGEVVLMQARLDKATPAMPKVWCPEEEEDCGAAVHHSNCCAQGVE